MHCRTCGRVYRVSVCTYYTSLSHRLRKSLLTHAAQRYCSHSTILATGLELQKGMETDYDALAERTRETVMNYAAEQWPLHKSSNGVEVSYLEKADTRGKVYKAIGIVNAPPSTTFEYILPGPLRLHWDKQVKSCEIVTDIQEGTAIVRSLSHGAAMGLIAPREYIDLVSVRRNVEGGLHFSYATGIDYPYPGDPSYVRGFNYPSTMMCFPLEDDPSRTRLVYAFHTDLKGMIPLKLIEATLPSIQITFFKNLRKAIKDKLKEKTGKTCLL